MTEFKVLRFRRLVRFVMINVPFWCLLFPPAATTVVSWKQVMTRTLLTEVISDEFL